MRIMYDAIYPQNIPANAEMVASYVDGKWPNYQDAVTRFPSALHVSIAVFAFDNAQVLDVERFDATPAQSVDWVLNQRKLGSDPWVYCSQSDWPYVVDAFITRKVAEPHYWIANYDGVKNIPPGAIGKQFQGTTAPGYDMSVMADYIPGYDPAPVTTTLSIGDVMFIAIGQHAIGTVDSGFRLDVITPDQWAAVEAAMHLLPANVRPPIVHVDDSIFNNLPRV